MVREFKSGGPVKRRLSVCARHRCLVAGVLLFMGPLAFFLTQAATAAGRTAKLLLFSDPAGTLGIYSTNGAFDTGNPFFRALGPNGRSCNTCHRASDGFSITPLHIQQRFAATNGTDPLFRRNDGSNCSDSPGVNKRPPAKSAYSLLLNKGLIRFSLPTPSDAQFTAKVVSNPYGCASTAKSNGKVSLTVYRRVLPALLPVHDSQQTHAGLGLRPAHRKAVGHKQHYLSPADLIRRRAGRTPYRMHTLLLLRLQAQRLLGSEQEPIYQTLI